MVQRVSPGPEPAMEFDAQLPNRNVLVEELVDDVELKAFDVHLQEVDVRVSIPAHDGGQVMALEGDYLEIALRHGVGAFVGIYRYGELKNAGVRREANGKNWRFCFSVFAAVWIPVGDGSNTRTGWLVIFANSTSKVMALPTPAQ